MKKYILGVIIGSYLAKSSFFHLINLQHNVGDVTGWYWQVLTKFWGSKSCLGAPKRTQNWLKTHFGGRFRLLPCQEPIFYPEKLEAQGGGCQWRILTGVEKVLGPRGLCRGPKKVLKLIKNTLFWVIPGSYLAKSSFFLLNNLQHNMGVVNDWYWQVLTKLLGPEGCVGASESSKNWYKHILGFVIGSYLAKSSFFLLNNLQHNVGDVNGLYWQMWEKLWGLGAPKMAQDWWKWKFGGHKRLLPCPKLILFPD